MNSRPFCATCNSRGTKIRAFLLHIIILNWYLLIAFDWKNAFASNWLVAENSKLNSELNRQYTALSINNTGMGFTSMWVNRGRVHVFSPLRGHILTNNNKIEKYHTSIITYCANVNIANFFVTAHISVHLSERLAIKSDRFSRNLTAHFGEATAHITGSPVCWNSPGPMWTNPLNVQNSDRSEIWPL